ncbi:MAG: hypothetical protein GX053_08365, partial [Tissierella sp.]|nr:hypothetical protein [Tissierella sp.]
MNPLEISFISLANYFAYMVISRKVIRDSSCPVRRSKTLVMVALIIMSISMGFIAMSPIGEYSFIIGLIVSILFTYFLYGLDLWNTLLVFIVTNMILFASGYISILVTRFLSGNDGLYFKDWLLAQQTNIFLLFLIYRYLPINILMKFKIHRKRLIYG